MKSFDYSDIERYVKREMSARESRQFTQALEQNELLQERLKEVMIGLLLAGKLPKDQLKAFELEIRSNEKLEKAVQHYRLSSIIIDQDADQDLRKKLRMWDREATLSGTTKPLKVIPLYIKLAIAGSVAFVIAVSIFLLASSKIDKFIESNDTIAEDWLSKEIRSPGLGAFPSNEVLIEQGLKDYNNQRYLAASKKFNNYLGKQNVEWGEAVRFYLAQSHYAMMQYDSAAILLKEILMAESQDLNSDQVNWYLGLCLVQQDKLEDAAQYFNNISVESVYSERAKEIIGILRGK